MAGMVPVPISVASCRSAFFVKPAGPCTLAICDTLREGLQNVRRPTYTDVYFDLSQADWVDSTFAGYLISLAGRPPDATAPAVHLLNPNPGTLDALERMHLQSLVDICQTAPETPDEWRELPHRTLQGEGLIDIVIKSHEDLIKADDRNVDTFGPVVDAMRADRQKKRSSEPQA